MAAIQVGIAVAIVGPLVVAVVIPRERLEGAAWAAGLGEIVRNRRFWILVVVSISINICWHFLVNWIPTYLKEERGMKFEAGNYLSTIPFLAADAGNLLGRLAVPPARRGRPDRRAGAAARDGRRDAADHGRAWGSGRRERPDGGGPPLGHRRRDRRLHGELLLLHPGSHRAPTGLVVGYLGAIGNLFAAGFQPFAGKVKDLTGSYTPVFAIIGLAPLIGLAALSWGWGVDRRRPPRRNEPEAVGLARSGWTPRGLSGRISPHMSFAVASTFAARTPPRSSPLVRAAVDKARLIWQGGGT